MYIHLNGGTYCCKAVEKYAPLGIKRTVWFFSIASTIFSAAYSGVRTLNPTKWGNLKKHKKLLNFRQNIHLKGTVLHCTELHRTVLYSTVLHYTALHHNVLHYTVLYGTVLYTLHCTTLFLTYMYYIALHCNAMHCTALHCIALYSTAL